MSDTQIHLTGKHLGCRPLLDACNALLYVRNAFRVTGLPVDASARMVKRRGDDLKDAAELGDGDGEYTFAFALDPRPTAEQIRQAIQRLQDPEQRFVDEFFWFWPCTQQVTSADPALAAIADGDKDRALHLWSTLARAGDTPESIAALHNLSVMHHLMALDWEQVALKEDLSEDAARTLVSCWREAFRGWEVLADDETFWSLVAARIRSADDPRLTTGFARRMRASLPEALDRINASLAVQYAEKGNLQRVKMHVTFMKETHQGKDDVQKTLDEITEPIRSRIRALTSAAMTRAEQEPAGGNEAAYQLLESTSEPLRVIDMLLPPSSHERADLHDHVADACMRCQVAFARETSNWDDSIAILEKAVGVAVSQETKEHLSEQQEICRSNRNYAHPRLKAVLKKLQEIQPLDLTEQIREIFKTIARMLADMCVLDGEGSRVYHLAADRVSSTLREIAVTLYNNLDESAPIRVRAMTYVLIIELHNKAKSLAFDPELRKVFAEDESKVNNLRVPDAKIHAAIIAELKKEGLFFTWLGPSISVRRQVQRTQPPAKKGPCFVATTVYGDTNHPNVCTFRRFRDQHLLPHTLGRAFVRMYYAYGGQAAHFVDLHPTLKACIRFGLDRLARILET